MKNKISKIFTIGIFFLLVFLSFAIAKSPDKNDVSIYFFNIGQGDASLIQQGSYQIMIDGGPDDKILSLLGEEMPLYDRKIETLVLSHPHADHLMGINSVLDRYEIGNIYFSGSAYSSAEYLSFLNKIKEKNINTVIPELGYKFTPYTNASLEFLWPGDKYIEKEIENPNDVSLVMRYCYFTSCALYTGDIEEEEQDLMLDHYSDKDISAKILKVPHHGARNAANNRLYTLTKSQFSIFSVGKDNQYGHPHQEASDLAKNNNSLALRTDEEGTIKFEINKEGELTFDE